MLLSLRRKIVSGFGASIAVLAIISAVSNTSTCELVRTTEERRVLHELQKDMRNLISDLVDAETGQRGYLLTGKVEYLEPYQRASTAINRDLAKIETGMKDDHSFDTLRPLVEKKLAELQDTIDLRRTSGLSAALEVVQSNRGKVIMDQIRALFADLDAKQSEHILTLNSKVASTAAYSTAIVLFGGIAAVSMMGTASVMIVREVNARTNSEVALKKSEQWLATTLGSIGDAVIATDNMGCITFINPVAQSLTGWSAEDARGRALELVFEIRNETTNQLVENPFKKVMRTGGVAGLANHTVLVSKQGKRTPIDDSGAPIKDESGAINGVVLVFRDVTERIAKEKEVEEQKHLLQSIVECMGDGLVVCDENGKFLIWNPAAEKIIGMGMSNAVPSEWPERYGVFQPDQITPSPSDDQPLTRAIHGESVDDIELFIRNSGCPNGVFISCTARPIKNSQGKIEGGVVVFRDRSERRKAESALQEANRELEAFSYSVSHDLRAPLRSIDGFSHALEEDYLEKLDDQGRNFIHRIRANTQRMAQLIEDMLELSRISRSELKREVVNLSGMAEAIARDLAASAASRKVDLKIAPDLTAEADPHLLRIVLTNLLENAWKFTSKRDDATITLGTVRQQNGKSAYYVKDNGAGFDMAYADKLFGVFQRLHGMSEFNGTGIGLATVKRIISRHGGQVWAEGAVDHGATFYFSL